MDVDGPERIGRTELTPVTPDSGWSVVGMGNLAGDAHVDLLLQHTDGSLQIWVMDGATRTQVVTPSPSSRPNANWFVAAVYDANGDGADDVLWQNVTGELRLWYMNGPTLTWTELLPTDRTNDPSWRVVGARAVNADDDHDLVWFHPEGWLQVWYMDGPTRLGFDYLNPDRVSDLNWRLTAIPNVTGSPVDLIWIHGAQGWFQSWDLAALDLVDSAWLIPPQVDVSWRILGSFTR